MLVLLAVNTMSFVKHYIKFMAVSVLLLILTSCSSLSIYDEAKYWTQFQSEACSMGYEKQGWVVVVDVASVDQELVDVLDQGEASAITYSLTHNLIPLLIDDN